MIDEESAKKIQEIVSLAYPNLVKSPIFKEWAMEFMPYGIKEKYGDAFFKKYEEWAIKDANLQNESVIALPNYYFNINGPELKRFLLEQL